MYQVFGEYTRTVYPYFGGGFKLSHQTLVNDAYIRTFSNSKSSIRNSRLDLLLYDITSEIIFYFVDSIIKKELRVDDYIDGSVVDKCNRLLNHNYDNYKLIDVYKSELLGIPSVEDDRPNSYNRIVAIVTKVGNKYKVLDSPYNLNFIKNKKLKVICLF